MRQDRTKIASTLKDRIFVRDITPNGSSYIIKAEVYINNGHELIDVRTTSKDLYDSWTKGNRDWVSIIAISNVEDHLINRVKLRGRSMWKSNI